MKKCHLLATGLVLLIALLLIAITAAVVLFKPFEKPQNVVYGGASDPRTCIGEGCYYASSDKYGGVYCDGYSCDLSNMTFVCYSTLEEYCRGCKPAEDPKACACTYNNVTAMYCNLTEQCYSNEAEFQISCASGNANICAEIEARLRNASPMDVGCGRAVRSVGIGEGDCNTTWSEIYASSGDAMIRKNILINVVVTQGFESQYPPFFEEACHAFCSSCNSTLCSPGQLCEHARPT